MIISVWRYSHLALAVSSFLLLTVASLSGMILAFEPVTEKAKGYKVDGFDSVTLAQSLPVLKEKLHGIQEIKVDENDFVTATYSDEDGNDKTSYINPATGEILGTPQKQKPLFEWMTSLHRSLFLHETGRAIAGITAFLLILIALSGVALIIQRQKSVARFFAPIEKGSGAQYYHTVFGRLSLIFILAVALSGTYLSLSRFIIQPEKKGAKVNEDDIREEPQKKPADFIIFQQTKLSLVEAVEYPFSDFPEDYYTLKLKDRELCINQVTGDVLAEEIYPASYTLAAFSLRWHTGRSNAVWAIVLAITSAYILFFIYSGGVITWKRIRSKSKNRFKPEECRIVILAGSENGSTYRFASALYQQLLTHNERVYLTDLDNYQSFPQAEHLVVMTSTYGEGDPPSNAKHFQSKLAAFPQPQQVRFSVVGFGSRTYVHFCRFAVEVDRLLRQQTWAKPLMDMVTVNDKSPQDFSRWFTQWTEQSGFHLILPRELLTTKTEGLQNMTVVRKTRNDEDDAFLIQLKTKHFKNIRSGDLLAVYPKNDHRERLYSIGKVNGAVQLSVKLHQHGLGSHFLNGLKSGDIVKARIIRNHHFYFPKKATQVILISNGTGIAPFLGMISENRMQKPCCLYCGFRNRSSFQLYESFLKQAIAEKKLTGYKLSLSREDEKQYVSDRLRQDKPFIQHMLANGGVVMICGSLAMQKDVLLVLEEICVSNTDFDVLTYQSSGRILMDCY